MEKNPSAKTCERLFLVDAHAYLHRAYHALPPLTSPAGKPVGALYGFASMLLSLTRREKPELLVVCFDAPGPTFRYKLFERYKATRKPIDEDLKSQLALSCEMASAMGFSCAQLPGWEADDLIATLARRGRERGADVVIVSGDKDALQLIDDHVRVLNEAKGTMLDDAAVVAKFGVHPAQVGDYLALTGDSSDNVPGVPGIGPVGAVKLLSRFGSLEALLTAAREGHGDIPAKTAESLRRGTEQVRFGRELVTLDSNSPVDLDLDGCAPAVLSEAAPSTAATERLVRLFTEMGFNSLLPAADAGVRAGAQAGASQAPVVSASSSSFPIVRFVSEKEFLSSAKTAPAAALSVRSEGEDLLKAAGPVATLALAGGEVCVFNDDALRKHRKALSEMFLSSKTLKIGHDLKTAIGLLRSAGLELAGPRFDTALAAWCLDPSLSKPSLAAAARTYLGLEFPPGAAPDSPPSPAAEAERTLRLHPLAKVLEEKLASEGLARVYSELELPLLDILASMEAQGVAVDSGYLQALRGEFAEKIAQLRTEIDELAGMEVNPNSPKQLGVLFFEKLGLPVVHKTEKGGASTDEETLRVLSLRHPLPAKIMDFRELSKLQSTYVEGLLARIDPLTRRVHTHFNQMGTETGRLSSLDPNLQNIPVRTPLGRKIRRAFTAAEGRVLLSADYSQIELHVLAHISGDLELRRAFESGEDVHLRTASEVFGVPASAVDKEMRRRAKAVNFGIVYGQTAHGLSIQHGIPFAEARETIASYFARYRGVESWIKGNLESARREGVVRTLYGRMRRLPDLAAKSRKLSGLAERAAGNTPIQGSAADLIKAAMVRVFGGMKGPARLVLQVHDELLFELPESEVGAFAPWVRTQMEEAVRLDVPIVVDLKVGKNWQDMEPLP